MKDFQGERVIRLKPDDQQIKTKRPKNMIIAPKIEKKTDDNNYLPNISLINELHVTLG